MNLWNCRVCTTKTNKFVLDALEASPNELFEVVASRKVRINVNRRFALKDAEGAHKALEARATSGSTVLTI